MAIIDSQPTFYTSRLRLVPLSDAHITYEAALDADPDVMRYVGNGKPRTLVEVEQAHQGRIARSAGGLGFWAGFRSCQDGSAPEEFVGWWILSAPKPRAVVLYDGPQAELGYRLAKKFWRQGLAKEGGMELLRYAFQDLGLSRVYGETMAINEASRATMSSLGMRFTRGFFEEFEELIPGAEHGEVEYAIMREEWEVQRRQK